MLDPKLVVLDEPVSALDKSVQAQVLNLLDELKAERALTYVFISHDLSVIEHVSDRIFVMYLGQVVETGSADVLAAAPQHPLPARSSPPPSRWDPHARMTEPPISGDPPNPIHPLSGCRFRTRCAFVMPRCAEAIPPPAAVSDAHHVACCLFEGEPAPIAA